jgi:exonuclease SbcC
MFLRQLKLQNIRSYLDQTIDFSSGSTLLSGDIGSGKSTLLLAIEFALFGLSKPDLPGEALLRKGATQGSVELSFNINNSNQIQEISIKRNLKKEKDSIKQTFGYLIINQVKKELTPVELKAEIINLLGYPEDLVSKNKNYLFRYTLYTPQEEMKKILQDPPEERLDVLRKIFNIDKYRNVRDNLLVYLKQLRTNLAVMEVKLEPLEAHQKQLEELMVEKEKVEKHLAQLTPKLEQVCSKIIQQQQEYELLEKKQKSFLDLNQQLQQKRWLLGEKKEQLSQLNTKEEFLQKQVTSLNIPSDLSLDKIKLELLNLEQHKNQLLQRSSTLQERITQIQSQIKQAQEQISSLQKETLTIEDKEKQVMELEEQIKLKEELNDKKKELEHQIEENSNFITKNTLLLQQSKDVQKKILSLEVCPTCFQKVSIEHKHHLSSEEQQKSDFAEHKLKELEQIKKGFKEKREEILGKIEIILKAENQLSRIRVELKHLSLKKEQLSQLREVLKEKVQENNLLIQEFTGLQNNQDLEKIKEKISLNQEMAQQLAHQQYLLQQIYLLKEQFLQTSKQISLLGENIHETEEKLSGQSDLAPFLSEQKEVIKIILIEEKELSILHAQQQTELQNIKRQEQPLLLVINNLKEQKNRYLRIKELYVWLEEYFLPLTHTIEKRIMLNIHRLFNQLFQEWFSILIDDENVNSKLDNSFTPLIEQNGYEVNFDNLSGGEKTSAALAYRLALNRVINDVIHDIKTKDLLILDEPTDGFSSEQLDKVREVLDRLHLKQIIIVSHESKIETFVEKVIRVQKNGHVSQVFN